MFQVIFTGVREGVTRSDAIINLAALFKTTPEQVEKLLVSSGHVLKKGITQELAGKYRAAIESAGGACRVEQEIAQVQTSDNNLPRTSPSQATLKKEQKFADTSVKYQNVADKQVAMESDANQKPNSFGKKWGALRQAFLRQSLISRAVLLLGGVLILGVLGVFVVKHKFTIVGAQAYANDAVVFRVYGMDSNQQVQYLAPSTIINLGDKKRITIFGNFAAPRQLEGYNNPFQSFLSEDEVTCSTHQFRTNRTLYFAGRNLTKEIIHVDDSQSQEMTIPANSMVESLWDFLCTDINVQTTLDSMQQRAPSLKPVSIKLERVISNGPGSVNELNIYNFKGVAIDQFTTPKPEAIAKDSRALVNAPVVILCSFENSVFDAKVFLPDGTFVQTNYDRLKNTDNSVFPMGTFVGTYSKEGDIYHLQILASRLSESIATLANAPNPWKQQEQTIERTNQYSFAGGKGTMQNIMRVIDGKTVPETSKEIADNTMQCSIRVADKAIEAATHEILSSVPAGIIDKSSASVSAEAVAQQSLADSSKLEDIKVQPPSTPKNDKTTADTGGNGINANKSFRDCPDCPEMVEIPTGSYEMGSNNMITIYHRGNEELPVHHVTIGKAFAIGKTELTQNQWKAIMGKPHLQEIADKWCTSGERSGPGNSDSPLSGSLAQPKPHGVRQIEEQAHEKDEKESRTGIQSQSGPGRDQGRQDTGGVV